MQAKHQSDLSGVMPKMLKRFIEQAPVAIAMFDKKMHYIAASSRWLDDCNVAFKDIVGKSHYEVVPNIPERWKEGHQRALNGVAEQCEEDVFEAAAGKKEWLRWELQPWSESPEKIGGIIMFVEHITKRKVAEQKIVELVAQLNRSNDELKSFAHICSHDLKAPIRNLANFSHLIRERTETKGDQMTQYYWNVIEENIERMQGMIQSFLLYAELGAKGVKKSWVCLEDVVAGVKVTLASEIAEAGAKIKIGSLPKVVADGSLLAHVFQNLLSNAIKFNHSRAPIVSLEAEQQDGGWLFSVQDNGIGIEIKHQAKIFESFAKLHSKNEYPGTGIGLSFSRKIIEEHGGKIWVQSSTHQGTQFCFTLPKTSCP